ncbi:hypothetical protein Cni_G25860 [Canna indica]|uniref:DUF1677 family protein n=1 Tax=Canna indica TaxID=4628 RepID=A0AAQ3QPU5_9LILI|nr:hypothetical protein Cni_G25860 [Canna indica]
MNANDEVESVECESCGMSEDCTPTYASQTKEFFYGRWICGLCSEAVKEKMRRAPELTMDEALESHTSLSKSFNKTIRLNPKLSLAVSMKDIARKISERRLINHGLSNNAFVRTMSCGPRLDVSLKQSQIH